MVLRLLVASSIMLFGLTIESDAGPLGYCDSFARDAANQKTGRADAGAVTIGDSADARTASATEPSLSPPEDAERWQTAYKTVFTACMAHYEPASASASVSSVPAKPPARAHRSAKPSRHHAIRTARSKRSIEPAPKSQAQNSSSDRSRKITKPAAAEIPQPVSDPRLPSKSSLAGSKPNQQTENSQECRNVLCWLRRSRR